MRPGLLSFDLCAGNGFISVALLAICTGLGLSGAVVSVTISALAAISIGATGAWTTVPYGLQFVAVLCTTLPAAMAMRVLGRKPVFLFGAACGIASGFVGYAAMAQSSLWLLCLSHALLGVLEHDPS